MNANLAVKMQRLAPFTIREDRSSRDSTVVAFTTTSAQMPVRIPHEQSSHEPVKGMMDRTKIAFAALVPALWLLLCGQGLPAQCIDCPKAPSSAHTCTLQNDKACSSDAVSSQDTTARRAASRLGKSGNTNPLVVNPISRSHAVERTPTPVSAQRESPIALATCWQFVCRTALEPRAPSSVS